MTATEVPDQGAVWKFILDHWSITDKTDAMFDHLDHQTVVHNAFSGTLSVKRGISLNALWAKYIIMEDGMHPAWGILDSVIEPSCWIVGCALTGSTSVMLGLLTSCLRHGGYMMGYLCRVCTLHRITWPYVDACTFQFGNP